LVNCSTSADDNDGKSVAILRCKEDSVSINAPNKSNVNTRRAETLSEEQDMAPEELLNSVFNVRGLIYNDEHGEKNVQVNNMKIIAATLQQPYVLDIFLLFFKI
jgi:hypothetical protein